MPPGAIVGGYIALAPIRRSGEQGHALALAGVILGWILTATVALIMLLRLAVLASVLAGWAAVLPLLRR